MPSINRFPCASALILLMLLAATTRAPGQQGVIVSGVGPINQSMGTAATAAPLDASGALNWNPASIAGLGHSEMEFGLGLIYPQAQLSSSLSTAVLSPGPSPSTLAGSDRSNSGFFALPTLGLVYQPEDSPWIYGLGVFAVGGFAVNYPADQTNPILSPAPPNGIGLGAVSSLFQVMQLAPTVAYQLTDHLSIGLAPTVDLATLLVDPAIFASPNNAGQSLFPAYPAATHSRAAWGLGFQTGLYYTSLAGWSFGASVKSPQWFEPFRYNAVDGFGRARALKFHLDLPLIVSLGVSYTGLSRTVLAADFRYMDYKNTNGFNRSGFAADGAVQGLGWDSIFVLALGAQYQLTDTLFLRAGYTYNGNPVPGGQAFFNIASPTILQHTISIGATYKMSDRLLLSLAYAHSFENSVQSSLVLPSLGPIPGSSVESRAWADFIILGASVLF
jgi:long-chain fatty acid transport protein